MTREISPRMTPCAGAEHACVLIDMGRPIDPPRHTAALKASGSSHASTARPCESCPWADRDVQCRRMPGQFDPRRRDGRAAAARERL